MFALFLSHEEMFTAMQALDRTQENHARYGFNVMFKMVLRIRKGDDFHSKKNLDYYKLIWAF